MKIFFLWCLLLVACTVTSENSPEKTLEKCGEPPCLRYGANPLPSEQITCASSDECTIAKVRCGCTLPDSPGQAVNKWYEQAFIEDLEEKCPPPEEPFACPQVVPPNYRATYESWCVNQQCEVVRTSITR